MPDAAPQPESPRLSQSRVFKTTRMGLLDCGYVHKSRGCGAYYNRAEPQAIMVVILKGNGRFVDSPSGVHEVEAGCALQHRPGLSYSVVPTSQVWEEFYFRLPAVLFESLSALGTLDPARSVLRPGVSPELIARFDDLLQHSQHLDPADVGLLLLRLHELVVTLYRLEAQRQGPGPHDAMVRAACDRLAGELDRPMDLRAMAADFALSYERFRKVFREQVGMPPGEYRIRRRLDRGRTLLAEQGKSVKRVAYELGYPDAASFSKQFKKIVGLNPSAVGGATMGRTVSPSDIE